MPAPPPTAGEPWIGIVDDDAPLRMALERALRGRGFRVTTFASGEEFLECDHETPPACIVLDVRLFGMSGFDVQDQLVKRGNSPPIVFITSHDGMLAEAARARSACLIKPFDMDALVALLRPHVTPVSVVLGTA